MKHDTFGEAGDYAEPIRPLDPLIYDLRKLRYRKNISQPEMARRMGYDVKTLKNVEAGKSTPKFAFVTTWAAALGVKLTIGDA